MRLVQVQGAGVCNNISTAERFYGLLELSNRRCFDDECCIDQRRQWNAQQSTAECSRQEKKGKTPNEIKRSPNLLFNDLYHLWRKQEFG